MEDILKRTNELRFDVSKRKSGVVDEMVRWDRRNRHSDEYARAIYELSILTSLENCLIDILTEKNNY